MFRPVSMSAATLSRRYDISRCFTNISLPNSSSSFFQSDTFSHRRRALGVTSSPDIAAPSSDNNGCESRQSYFELLGIDRSFSISTKELKMKYKTLMKDLHPDLCHSSADEDKLRRASLATDVTRAYDVLENPLSRALHLLELWGAPIIESDGSITDHHLLLKVMEAREEVDNASSDEDLRPLLKSCRETQNELCNQLAVAFREANKDRARVLTAELRYWSRIEETILDKISHVH